MQLTNSEIFNAKDSLERLLQEKLPVKTAYGLAKLALKLNEHFGVIEQVRQGLVRTYGEPDPTNPTHTMVTPQCKNFEKFEKEYQELMEQEVELVIEAVLLPDTLEITPSALMVLEKFVKVGKQK